MSQALPGALWAENGIIYKLSLQAAKHLVGNCKQDAGLFLRAAATIHTPCGQHRNLEQKQYCNKFSEDFYNGPRQKKKIKNKTLFEKCSVLSRHFTSILSFSYRLMIPVLPPKAQAPYDPVEEAAQLGLDLCVPDSRIRALHPRDHQGAAGASSRAGMSGS